MQSQSPPSTGALSAPPQSPESAAFASIKKRNRVPVSCGPCRSRKLRCNRGQPCDKCTRRGDVSSCTYVSPVTKRRAASGSLNQASPDEMRSRIDRLENLVLSLVSQEQEQEQEQDKEDCPIRDVKRTTFKMGMGDSGYADPARGAAKGGDKKDDVDKMAKQLGLMKMDNDKSFFVPETHWYALLGQISEVKNFFNDHKVQYLEHAEKVEAVTQVVHRPGSLFFSGIGQPESKAEILESFPHKGLADALISRYFEAYDPALHIIHGPTFQEEYDAFWLDPDRGTYPWLGMVFAMMCIALCSFRKGENTPDELDGQIQERFQLYRLLTAQCILKTDMCFPQTPVIEALVLHIHSESKITTDLEHGMLPLVALTVRSAMRMGFHIDSAPFPNIKPFQVEMRRRVWSLIRHYDLCVSAQHGLPPMIRLSDTNTRLPLNVYDDELTRDMEELPKGRPLTEVTPATYMIVMAQLIRMFAVVVELSQNVMCCPTYDVVMRVDRQLDEFEEQLPPVFRFAEPLDKSIPGTIHMQRMVIRLIFLRCRTFLHRRWVCPAISESRYTYSRRACIGSSMEILGLLSYLGDEPSEVCSMFDCMPWHSCSFTLTDFFLAAMMVAWDLHVIGDIERAKIKVLEHWSPERTDEMIAALDRSIVIWKSLQRQSLDAYKASLTLTVVLKKIKQRRGMDTSSLDGNVAAMDEGGEVDDDIADSASGPLDQDVSPATTLESCSVSPLISKDELMAGPAPVPLNEVPIDTFSQPLGLSDTDLLLSMDSSMPQDVMGFLSQEARANFFNLPPQLTGADGPDFSTPFLSQMDLLGANNGAASTRGLSNLGEDVTMGMLGNQPIDPLFGADPLAGFNHMTSMASATGLSLDDFGNLGPILGAHNNPIAPGPTDSFGLHQETAAFPSRAPVLQRPMSQSVGASAGVPGQFGQFDLTFPSARFTNNKDNSGAANPLFPAHTTLDSQLAATIPAGRSRKSESHATTSPPGASTTMSTPTFGSTSSPVNTVDADTPGTPVQELCDRGGAAGVEPRLATDPSGWAAMHAGIDAACNRYTLKIGNSGARPGAKGVGVES